MWPIYFNIASHIWIAYLFFLNGLLLHFCIRGFSSNYRDLTQSFEAQLLASFFLSIGSNGLILLMLDFSGLAFSYALWLLPTLSALSVFGLWRISKSRPLIVLFEIETSYARILLYAFVFVVLFYNGGLIEQVSDAWWHMSLANKMGLANSFELERGHLNGIASRYYPSLWHGNLAVANILSGISIPVFWNSFTAWGGMLKVMAFYLFAYGLTDDKRTATFASLLFILLPGIGNSYLRVSAWPSHISYMAWFSMFYLCFFSLRKLEKVEHGFVKAVSQFVSENAVIVICFLALTSIVWFTHQAELVWFSVAMFCYFIARSLGRGMAPSCVRDGSDVAITSFYRLSLGAALFISVWRYLDNISGFSVNPDLNIVFGLPVALTLLLMCIEFSTPLKLSKRIVRGLFFGMVVLAFISIDYQHLASLFFPELALPDGATRELPMLATGYFGGQLTVPGWHLQLRHGLLFSGILSIPIALVLVFLKPSRVTMFLASTGSISLLFCISPYLHHWLRDTLGYHSSWRIVVLIFHPLTIAVCLQLLWNELGQFGVKRRNS